MQADGGKVVTQRVMWAGFHLILSMLHTTCLVLKKAQGMTGLLAQVSDTDTVDRFIIAFQLAWHIYFHVPMYPYICWLKNLQV